MKRIDSPWDLPDRTIERADNADREIRITDFALMAVLPFRSLEVAGLPDQRVRDGGPRRAVPAAPRARRAPSCPRSSSSSWRALMALLVYSGMANHIEWTRRVGHVAILCGLVWAGGTGRLSLRSVGAGPGGRPDRRGRRSALVGHRRRRLHGPAHRLPRRPQRRRVLPRRARRAGASSSPTTGGRCGLRSPSPIVGGLVLTYSRTGPARRRLRGALDPARPPARRSSAGRPWSPDWSGWSTTSPTTSSLYGPFSNRSGSDALRDRIIAQEHVQLADAPWFGHGPGTARVSIGDLEFFFHNSYLATRQEGGWAALLLVLALMAYAFLRLTHAARAAATSPPPARRRPSSASPSWPSPSARCCSTPRWRSPSRWPSATRCATTRPEVRPMAERDLPGGQQPRPRRGRADAAAARRGAPRARSPGDRRGPPDSPREVLDAAAAVGAVAVAIRADGRRDYVAPLRSWDRTRARRAAVVPRARAGVRDRGPPRGGSSTSTRSRAARPGGARSLSPAGALGHPRAVRRHGRAASGAAGRTPTGPTDLPVLAAAPPRRLARRLPRAASPPTRASTSSPGPWPVAQLDATSTSSSPATTGYVPAVTRDVRARARSTRSARVRRLGHVAPADLLRRVDLVVFPSVWAEPFGLVVAEAMAAGVPFVISDAGALPEVAGPDHPWVARAGDAADLARVIERGARRPTADDVRAVTDRARRRWEAEYSPQAGRLRVRRLLEELAPMSRPTVAIAHDYLTQRGGAERVVLTLMKAFPEATVYTTLYDPDGTYPEFADGEHRHLAAQPVAAAAPRPPARAAPARAGRVPDQGRRRRDDRVEQRLGARLRHRRQVGRLLLLAGPLALRQRALPRRPDPQVADGPRPDGDADAPDPVGQARGPGGRPLPRHLAGGPRADPGDVRHRAGDRARAAQHGRERRPGADRRARGLAGRLRPRGLAAAALQERRRRDRVGAPLGAPPRRSSGAAPRRRGCAR